MKRVRPWFGTSLKDIELLYKRVRPFRGTFINE